MKIINNFLNKKDLDTIKDHVLNIHFPWYFQPHKVIEGDGQIQFTHTVWREGELNSPFRFLVDIVLLKLKAKKIIRAKFNLTWKTDKIEKTKFHIDTPAKSKTAIFYLNTNNGKTIFKNKKSVKSVENKIVIFNSSIKHMGTTHTDTDYRLVLNINYN
jgi:hypothetical protein|tara:strand:+ start:751 stop:1224 length:474 start_codon:yes stop_codon:yes gene_type:complete